MSISGSFFSAARSFKGNVAIAAENHSITYGQLAERTSRLCNVLRAFGIFVGDVVAGIMPNKHELVELDLACATGGFLRTLLNSRAPAEDYVHCLNLAGAKILVFDASITPIIDSIRDQLDVQRYVCVGGALPWADDYEALLAKASSSCEQARIAASAPHSIYFTSGTTGKPKGVLLSHLNWMRIIYCYTAEMDPWQGKNDVVMLAAPLTHATGSLVMPTLLRGSKLLLLDHFDAGRVNQLLASEGVSSTFMAPTMIQLLMQHVTPQQAKNFRLRCMLYGGAPFPTHRLQEALELFGPVMVQGYGQWESPVAISLLTREDHMAGLKGNSPILSSGGRASMFSDIEILDDDGNILAPGSVGEISASGPQLMVSYYKNEEATKEIRHGIWQRTGDIGYKDEQGYLYITDRKKDMIITGGMNVYPTQVEHTLYQHDELEELCVVGVPDDLWGETVHVVAVRKKGATISDVELLAWAKDRLPKDRRPRTAEFVDALPKNNYGKILRRHVRDAVRSRIK